MWDELANQIALECQELEGLFEYCRPLLGQCSQSEPGRFEVSALATLLHSFYGAVENIFMRSYLQFRHVFRSVYSSRLDWDRMAPLVLECEETFRRLREELARFLKDLEAQEG